MARFLGQVGLRPSEWLGLGIVAALVFVWPIPGTIALRNILLVAGLAIWLAHWFRFRGAPLQIGSLKGPLLWYAALTAWLVAGAFLVSVDTPLSLRELKGQWLRSALAGLLGLLVAAWAVRPRIDGKVRLAVLLVVLPLSLQMFLTLADTLWHWVAQGSLPGRASKLVSGKLGISFNVNLLLAIVAADILGRSRKAEALIPVTKSWIGVLVAAGVATTYLLHSRNGTLCLAALFMVCVFLHLGQRPIDSRRRAPILLLVLLVAATAVFAIKSDRRWLTFQESVALGWKTGEHRAWLDSNAFPLPRLKDGKPVQHSAYMRTAWTKESLKVLAERPLGVGFMRGAMGRAFQDKYGYGLGGHADNGLIDFSLGAGLPGTLLGVGLLASLMLLGWRTVRRTNSGVAMALFLVAMSFAMRTLLDSTTRDNFLEQFLFMSGLLGTLSAAILGQSRQATAPH